IWSLVLFFRTLRSSFMKFGLSIVSRNVLSSFFNFQSVHREMHSSGVSGAHFLHVSPRVFSISIKSRFFSAFLGMSIVFSITLLISPFYLTFVLTGWSERLGVKNVFGRDPS